MKTDNDLSTAESTILGNVIDLYIRTGLPVSSRTLKTSFLIDSSTANIRKLLHSLEEKGYLYKPHISAGRIPSDRGYRFYVDRMKKPKPLSGKFVEEIRHRIGQEWGDVRDVMYRTSRMLSEVTRCMGLIMGIAHSHGTVSRISIVQLEGTSVLVLLKISADSERKVFIDFPKRYRPHVIDRAVQLINERVAGYPLEEAHRRLEYLLKECDGIDREIAEALSIEAEYLFNSPYAIEYSFDGLGDEVSIPELNDTRILRNLVRLMGERSLMLSMMKDRMREDTMITIGGENLLEELEDFSVITNKFSIYGYDGVFGVLGPTRMSYDLVLSLLDMMGSELKTRSQ